MALKLSQTSEMAINGLVELAQLDEDERLMASEIAHRQNVSESYLAKVFHKLGRAGIVASRRGKIGGFTLARPPAEISVGEVVRLFDGEQASVGASGSAIRRSAGEAPLSEMLRDVQERIYAILDNVTLGDLCQKTGGHARFVHADEPDGEDPSSGNT